MPDDTGEQDRHQASSHEAEDNILSRRNLLLGSSALVAAATLTSGALAQAQKKRPLARRLRLSQPARQAQYSRHLGRRYRHRQHQRLFATA